MISALIKKDLRDRVNAMIDSTIVLPHDPVSIYTKAEIKAVESTKRRILMAYFCDEENPLDDTVLDFIPNDAYEYCLFGIYFMLKGDDDAIKAKLEEMPGLFILTIPNVFEAMFIPTKPPMEVTTMEFDETNVIINGEVMACVEAVDRLHGSPYLAELTFYMSSNYAIFA